MSVTPPLEVSHIREYDAIAWRSDGVLIIKQVSKLVRGKVFAAPSCTYNGTLRLITLSLNFPMTSKDG